MYIRITTLDRAGLTAKVLLSSTYFVLSALASGSVHAQVPTTLDTAWADAEVIELGQPQSQTAAFAELPQIQSAETMSLEQLEARLRSHPSLEANDFSAAADRLRAESALALPDPVVSMQLNNVPLLDPSFSEYLPSNKAVGIRQALPSRSERKANSLKSLRQADKSDLSTEEDYARMRGRVFALIKARAYILEERSLIKARLNKYDELKEIIDIEISSGRPLLYRIAQIDIERADTERALSETLQNIRVIDAELTNWIGVIPNVELPKIRKTPLTGNALQFYGVRVADATVEVRDADVQKAEADFKPDWGVNLTYQQRESGQGPRSNFDGEDWVSGGVSFTIPLWAGKRQAPNLQAAKSDRQAAISQRTALARKLQSDWMQYEAMRRASVENIQILEQKITALGQQADAQLIQYESGSGDYSKLIDAEIAKLTLETQITKEASRRDQMILMMNSLVVTP